MSKPNIGTDINPTNTVNFLDSHRISPDRIDWFDTEGWLKPTDLAITSIGSRSRSVITPFYSGIVMGWGLTSRVSSFFYAKRPLAEAEIRLSEQQDYAKIILRFAGLSEQTNFLQGAWLYPNIDTDLLDGNEATTWKLLDLLSVCPYEPVPESTGIVQITHERINSKSPNWKPSGPEEPDVVLQAIHDGFRSLDYMSAS